MNIFLSAWKLNSYNADSLKLLPWWITLTREKEPFMIHCQKLALLKVNANPFKQLQKHSTSKGAYSNTAVFTK